MSQDSTASGNQATASLLSANGGDLTIIAGADASHAGTGRGNVTSEGADLLARQTVRIEGNAVSLLASDSRSQFDSVTKTKSVTVGAALAGTVGSLITRAYDMAEASRQGTGNRCLDNALALKAGYDGWKAYDNLGKALAVEADGAAAADGDSTPNASDHPTPCPATAPVVRRTSRCVRCGGRRMPARRV